VTGLVIEAALDDVRRALGDVGDVVVVAPPGTGKTTLIPLALIDEPWVGTGRIMVLEPRRLATRAAARRMSYLVGDDVGGTVGYVTRDERQVSNRTRVEVVTEGVLTRRIQNDPQLPGVAAILFDEIHERNLQTDLGLALTLELRATLRPDLRLVAMSATLETVKIATLLGSTRPGSDVSPSPIVRATSEPFPIEERWLPRRDKEWVEPATAAAVMRALTEQPGDVLVFLPGAGEISRVATLLAAAIGEAGLDVDVYPLYGMLSLADQDLALSPSPPGRRRVVLATDIAETSLTVDGVRIVVDAGLARVPRFDARSGLTRLRTVTASRSSGDQRAGRAGRLGPGIVYRLWSKGEQVARPRTLDPEITQVELAGLALELAVWGSEASSMPFLDQPPKRTMDEARSLLRLLGAIDAGGAVTALGRRMNDLPLHPRLARMVTDTATHSTSRSALAAPVHAATACALAALLDERDVMRGRPDDMPSDVGVRLALLADGYRRHPLADGRAVGACRQRAFDIARRAGLGGIDLGDIDPDAAGALLALAYPDRIAFARSQPGRFQLRSGSGAWVAPTDPLAGERFVVAADLDGDRRQARIRLAAPISADVVADLFADDLVERISTGWDQHRDELVERVERRLDGILLEEIVRRPTSAAAAGEGLVTQLRRKGLEQLAWTAPARSLRSRVQFLHHRLGEPWPAWSDDELLADAELWVMPYLSGSTSLGDMDVERALRSRLDPRLPAELDRLAPAQLTVPSGRAVTLDYGDGTTAPHLAVAVQELFGLATTPAVLSGAGRATVPVVLHLLSPAGRPVQVTTDLAGFWAGSWSEVRKQMAGRYPKHAWPVDPANASPPVRRGSGGGGGSTGGGSTGGSSGSGGKPIKRRRR
jgi:ATP-dependent helicase HrpB